MFLIRRISGRIDRGAMDRFGALRIERTRPADLSIKALANAEGREETGCEDSTRSPCLSPVFFSPRYRQLGGAAFADEALVAREDGDRDIVFFSTFVAKIQQIQCQGGFHELADPLPLVF